MNGIKKCRIKNRFSVGLATANPPHSHWTKWVPKYGIAENIFVITVAPHGSTYPIKAVIMDTIKIVMPVFHTFFDKKMNNIDLDLYEDILIWGRMTHRLYEYYEVFILSSHFEKCELLRKMLILYWGNNVLRERYLW